MTRIWARNHLLGARMRRLLTRAQFMAESLIETPGVHRPRNVDWRRAAALLDGDWGTSKLTSSVSPS